MAGTTAAVVEIESLSPDGDGLATMGRRTLRVPFTIPGERVRVAVETGPRDGAGTVIEVLRPSPHRVPPACRHFGPDAVGGLPCGGCTWQHIAHDEQIRAKTALVTRLVRTRIASAPTAEAASPVQPGGPWGYRQKVHFVFANGPGRTGALGMGHYARGSRRVLSVTECPVHDERGNALAFATCEALARSGVRSSGNGSDGSLRSLVVRVSRSTDERLATLVVTHDRDRRLRDATRAIIRHAPPGTSFHLNVHERTDGMIFGAATRTLAGQPRLRDEVAGIAHLMSPTAFFQTNVAAADALVSRVIGELPPPPSRVLDLYAGAGLFALPLARAGHRVMAVESNRQAVADGLASLRLNRLDASHCRFVAGRTEDAVSVATRADAVVLDPPREGCSPAVLSRVFGQVRPSLAVYVSCNPVALADDLAAAAGYGYTVRSLAVVDMFPHTAHVETVAVLTR